MRLNRLKKPLAEYTYGELKEEYKSLGKLLHSMVGSLYPPLVRADIAEIRAEIWERDRARNWYQDSHLENGNYRCMCVACGKTFIGYKRRVVCRSCTDAHQA